MSVETPTTSRLRPVLREPTLHFVLLAVALFAVSAAARARNRDHVIEIDEATVAARIASAEANRGAPLSPEERQQVQEDYIDQQVLAREARVRGLDDDAQIRYLLAQKMLDVLSADVIQPSQPELAAYYEAHRSRYASSATVTADELVLGTDKPVPTPLRDQLRAGVAPRRLVSTLPMQRDVLSRVTLHDLTSIFDTATAQLVFAAQRGDWVGPYRSVRGQHWFRVTQRTESLVPPLDSVRERVRLDWIAQQEQIRLHRRVSQLRQRYTVFVTHSGAR
jgi:PPIC-type PPIASE domain